MQKRGKANCPMCRAPTVLKADRCRWRVLFAITARWQYIYYPANVDWALLNFMQDWFPIEAKAKLKNNEREAAQEELEELGLNSQGCTIMW